MASMEEAFQAGDVFIDYPYEGCKFRWEKKTKKVFGRFYGQIEHEIDHTNSIFRDAMSAGKLITREEYYRD